MKEFFRLEMSYESRHLHNNTSSFDLYIYKVGVDPSLPPSQFSMKSID